MGGDDTQPYNEPWMDGYQNDIYYTRSSIENFTKSAYENHISYYFHQSGMDEYPYMINCRLNKWPAEAFSVVDSFVPWAMYSETHVDARFIPPDDPDNTPVDIFEDAYSHALYRRDKIMRFNDNSMPHVMALCNRQDKTNGDADVDDRREYMAYTVCRGLIYMKAHFDGKDEGCCVWQGELCVDTEGNIQYPTNTADDAGYYGWLGVPIEDCQYVMGTPSEGPDLQQGGFEGATNEWLWSGTGSWGAVTTDPHGGSKCAKLMPTNVTGDWESATLYQNITTGIDFTGTDQWGTLSFWVRADEPRLIYVEIYDNVAGTLLQRGHRFAPKGYWKRWVMRFESAGASGDITVRFHVGNGYEPPNYQAIPVYLDDVELWDEDIWTGLSRKFENGMVLWHQQSTDQTFTIPTTGLKRLNTQDVPPGEGWDDPELNTGETESGPTVTVPCNPDGGTGGALFLYGSPVFQPATYYVDTHQQRLLKFSDRAGSEYINGVTSGTFIVETDPTANNGSGKILPVVNTANRRRVSYLKFNIGSYIPSDATLVKARLYLTTALTHGDSLIDTLVVYNCVDSWVEDEAKWNVPYTGGSWTGDHGLGNPVDSVAIDGTIGKEYSLGVKSLVQDVLDGNGVPDGYLNVGLVDRHGGNAAHAMASEESNISQFRPMLLVVYNRPSSGMSLNRDFNHHVRMEGVLVSGGVHAVALPSN